MHDKFQFQRRRATNLNFKKVISNIISKIKSIDLFSGLKPKTQKRRVIIFNGVSLKIVSVFMGQQINLALTDLFRCQFSYQGRENKKKKISKFRTHSLYLISMRLFGTAYTCIACFHNHFF